MDESTRSPAPATEQAASAIPPEDPARAAKRPVAEPVTTLTDYFHRKRYRPSRFLADLEEGNIWSFSEEDQTSALGLSAELDPKFTRTLSLAAAALQARDVRFRRPILHFVWRSTEQRLRDNPRYIGGGLSKTPDVVERLHGISRALTKGLEESKPRVESLNILMAAALWLHYSEDLPLRAIVDELVSTISALPRIRRPDDAALAGYVGEQGRAGPKALLPLIGLLEPWIEQAKRAARHAAAEQDHAEKATDALERTREALERVEAENAALRTSLEGARAAATSAEEQLRAGQTHHEHGMNQLRSQIAFALDGRLAELLDTAKDALELDEPRVHVAQEKLAIAAEELQRQAEWLRSSA
jgi:hypothetical protein